MKSTNVLMVSKEVLVFPVLIEQLASSALVSDVYQ